MSYFNGHTICGKLTDLNYLHATLINSETMKCPGVYVPCSNETSPEHTICVHPENMEEHCPITFIDVVYEPEQLAINESDTTLNSTIPANTTINDNNTIAEAGNSTISDENTTTQVNATIIEISEKSTDVNETISEAEVSASLIYANNMKFVFDKHTDSLPITRTLVDSGLPCLNSPGFIMPSSGYETIDVELDVYTNCGENSPEGKVLDDRYKKLNISTSEYEMQEEYGIIG